MRKLPFTPDWDLLKGIKEDLVPVLFTEHQFDLIRKKCSKQMMTQTEKNEFSRTISRKMKAINKILGKETDNVFVYGKEKMIKTRLETSIKYLKKFTRKFKNKQIIITGSFLYKESYNDIDIFVVSKYEKEDYKEGKFHINYLTEDVYSSLFFASIKQLCLSNQKLEYQKTSEKIDLNTFISLYQELFNDLDKKFIGVRKTLREFLLQAAYLSNSTLPDSLELSKKINLILKAKRSAEVIKKIFVQTILVGVPSKEALITMKEMILSYKNLIKEYSQHKEYYLNLMGAFEEVAAIAG
ncbi:MAG: hypothetical protein ABIH82_03620 [Candidatus Woesearchaeota archaeon]